MTENTLSNTGNVADTAESKKKHRRGRRKNAHEKEEEMVKSMPSPPSDKRPHSFRHVNDARIPDELKSYFKSIESMLTEEALSLKTAEERDIFLQNVFEEVDSKEFLLATDFDGSRILEKLLHVCSDFHLRVFMDRLRGRFLELFTHRYASHVVQTLLSFLSRGFGSDMEVADDTQGILLSSSRLFLNMLQELAAHWVTLTSDAYGSHLLRLILNLLTGNRLASDIDSSKNSFIRSRASKKYHDHNKMQTQQSWMTEQRQVPPEFSIALNDIANVFLSLLTEVDLRIMTTHAVAGPVLQALLVIFKEDLDTVNQLIDRLLMGIQSRPQLEETAEKRRLHYIGELVKDPVGSLMFEKIALSASSAMFDTLLDKVFKGSWVAYARHPIANHVVQSLLEHARSADQVEAIAEELMPILEKLLLEGRPMVVYRLVFAAAKHQCLQKELVKELTQILQIGKEEDRRKAAMPCLLRLQTFDDLKQQPADIQIAGCQIVQSLLDFKDPNNLFMVGSICTQTPQELVSWCKHPAASRVVEAFFIGAQIGPKVKRKVARMLSGQYLALATNKFGCHTIEKIWLTAEMPQKEAMASELAERYTELSSDFYGRIIARKFRVEFFKRRPEDWKQQEAGQARKMTLFTDLLGDQVGTKTETNVVADSVETVVVEKSRGDVLELQSKTPEESSMTVDASLNDVLQAIEASAGHIKSKKSKRSLDTADAPKKKKKKKQIEE